MKELLVFLEEMEYQIVVIIDDLKRLARDIQGHFVLRTEIGKRGGQIESPSHKFDESPTGKFIESVFASAAEF